MALFGYIISGQCIAYPNKRIKCSSNTLCSEMHNFTAKIQNPPSTHTATTWNNLETTQLLSVNVNNRYPPPNPLIIGGYSRSNTIQNTSFCQKNKIKPEETHKPFLYTVRFGARWPTSLHPAGLVVALLMPLGVGSCLWYVLFCEVSNTGRSFWPLAFSHHLGNLYYGLLVDLFRSHMSRSFMVSPCFFCLLVYTFFVFPIIYYEAFCSIPCSQIRGNDGQVTVTQLFHQEC